MTFTAFSKIGQFRNVIHHVKSQTDFKGVDASGEAIYDHTSDYPVMQFRGTVKMHGTNSAIVLDENREITIQSRSRTITVLNDNAGFAAFAAGLSPAVLNLFPTNTAVFGEWAGGNIQKGVALNGLPKVFVIFGLKNLVNDKWLNVDHFMDFKDHLQMLNDENVFVTTQFPTFEIEIDFNKPELAQERLIEITEQVEKECPVGKFFDVSGVGEGVVWDAVGATTSEFRFKVKGEIHSTSKVKKLADVDVQKVENVREFIEITVTPGRLEQGLQVLKERKIPLEQQSTGIYLKWLVEDIITEELDTLVKNGLCAKDVNSAISNAGRAFWFKSIF